MKNLNVRNKQLGQGMTEYIIIVALIAVAAIGAYSLFGSTVKHQVAGLANEISGTSANAEIGMAKTGAQAASNAAAQKADMGTYDAGATSAISQ